MKKRKVVIPILLVLISSITFWLVTNKRNSSTISKELRDFAIQDTASVTKIFLATKQPKSLTLTREADGTWKADGKYLVRPDAIRILLRTMHDLAVQQPVSRLATENVIKQLAAGGTKVEVYAGDKLIKVYFVGNETPDMLGTYMLMRDVETGENSSEPFVMELKGFNGYLTPRYSVNVDDWRERVVFRYFAPDIRSIKVEHPRQPEQSLEVRQTGPSRGFGVFDRFGKPLPFDTMVVKQFISYFNYIGHEGFATDLKDARRDSTLRSTPEHVITVTDAKGKTTRVAMYLKKNNGVAPEDSTATKPVPYDPDRMYATVNGSTEVIQVQYYVFGKLLQTPGYFIRSKN